MMNMNNFKVNICIFQAELFFKEHLKKFLKYVLYQKRQFLANFLIFNCLKTKNKHRGLKNNGINIFLSKNNDSRELILPLNHSIKYLLLSKKELRFKVLSFFLLF